MYKIVFKPLWLNNKNERNIIDLGLFRGFMSNFKLSNIAENYSASWIEKKIYAADLICAHTFNFLGTGLKNWGDPINWHNDIKTNHKWSKKFYTDYKQKELIPSDGVDIKIPWELSRFHHLVTLAQAWRLTNEKKYSLEFFSQWESWRESNPFCYGVNWTNTMEVAIRAINLIVAVDLLGGAPGWDVNRGNILKSIRQHGLYIGHNLEIGVFKGQIIAGNHYLANICGMAVIGMSCQGLPEASRWVKTGIKALEQEMKGMVLDDGFFFESSTSYHRLAIELFLFPVIIGQMRGFEFSESYLKKIEKMLDIILYLTTPAGTVPQIGDNDDGRLLILSGYPDWPRHDYRYLLGIGSVLFNRADFKAACESCPEEVFWLFGKEGVEKFKSIVPDQSPIQTRSFSDAGLYVIRNDEKKDYALIRAGTLPKHVPTAHVHNDTLSLELWIAGKSVFIDPGTYCYTSNINKRNHFRGTTMHNTVRVNGEEINPITDNDIFKLEQKAEVKILEWFKGKKEVRFIAEHNGYERLYPECKHQREVKYDFAKRIWNITDRVISTNNDPIKFEVRFHSLQKIRIVYKDNNSFQVHVGNALMINSPSNDIRFYKVDSEYAPSYGVKHLSTNLIYKTESTNQFHYQILPKLN